MQALCVGSATIDIIVIVADRDVERMTLSNATQSFLMLEQGRKIESQSITRHLGGGAVNAAAAMARLGVAAAPLVKIGRDAEGEEILETLRRKRIDTRHVIETQADATGSAVMLSAFDRNATIFTRRGANTLLRPNEISHDALDGKRLVYVAPLSNRSADCLSTIVDRAGAAFVAVNPGLRQITSRAAALLELLKGIDLLTMNTAEAAALAPALAAMDGDPDEDQLRGDDGPAPRLLRLGFHFGGFDLGLAAFMRRLRRRGARRVVVTDGLDGAWLGEDHRLVHVPAMKADVLGTAGAGDAFASTLSARLAGGATPEDALRAGSINAAAAVTVADTQGGLLDATTLGARLKTADLPARVWRWG